MENFSNPIETIARGVCIKNNHLLLCRGKKAGNLYLPGGHIEFGETGAFALEREMLEEAGVSSHVTAFLGCAEHAFLQNGTENHHEINLIYSLDIPSLNPSLPVHAQESWIAFEWMPLSDLPSSSLEPASLRSLIANWFASPSNHLATTSDRLSLPSH